MNQTKVAIIIVTYNAMPWVEQCFMVLKEIPSNAGVYVIDNGSRDGTQKFIQNNLPDFKFYQSKENLGFGKANNLGFKMAINDGCTHFLLLNQDAKISWDNVLNLAQLQHKNPEFGIISPLQLYNDSQADFLHLKSLMKKSYTYFNDLVCENKLKALYEISYTNAAIWMISKTCLQKVGGFDPIFPHYGEDNDYSNRVNFFKLKIGLAARVKAYHFRNQTQNTKKETSKEHYVKFLVRAKQMDKKTYKVCLRIALELVKGMCSKNSSLGQLNSWKAFFKLGLNYKRITTHKNINKKTDFSFIN